MAGNHDVGGKATACLIEDFGLARRAYIFYNTTVIGSKPEVTGSIDCGGIDIAQLKGVESHELLDILV